MIETKINFRVDERTNRFSKNGKEWVLYAKLRDHESWVLKTWDKKPTPDMIKDIQEIILRSFEFYHKHLTIPSFKMKII